MADRYAFIASFGLVLAAVALLCAGSDGGLWTKRLQARAPRARESLGAAFLVFFAAVTWQRVRLWHDTEALFTETLRRDPSNIFAARTLGRYYSVTKSSPERAVPVLEGVIRLREERLATLDNASLLGFERYSLSELRNELGIASRESGQYEKALALHEEAIAGIPSTGRETSRAAGYYFQMGLAYDRIAEQKRRSGDQQGFVSAQEEALGAYRRSIERLPVLVQAYQNAGLALFRLERFQEAAELLEHAVTLAPNNIEAEGLLAKAYLQLGNTAKAHALLDEAIEKAERRRGSGPLLDDLRRMRAVSMGPRAPSAEVPPLDSDERFIALFRDRRYEEALGVALSLQKTRGTADPGLFNNVGLCYYKLARYPEAERSFLEAIRLRPAYSTAMDNLSLVYAKQGDLGLALAYAEKALKLQPGDPGILRHLEAYRQRQLAGRPPEQGR
jgi:tetratricopeptide (TPR) repeat protein